MSFACLGWGSLIWDPGSLPVSGVWSKDGPSLPLEFARESRDGRMILVIVEDLPQIPTLWAKLAVTTLEEAVQILLEREGANGSDRSAVGRCLGYHTVTPRKWAHGLRKGSSTVSSGQT